MSIGFLLLPNFSLLALSSSVEPLRMANRLSGQTLYECFTLGDPGNPVTSSSGLSITPELTIDQAHKLDAVFVCGCNPLQADGDHRVVRWLESLAWRGITLGALGTGTWSLARAGLLNGYRCTIHWENIASLREEFPELIISAELYEMDRNRYTCAGGSAAFDMFVSEIGSAHGSDLAAAITEYCLCDRVREHNERQRVPLVQQLGSRQPKLAEAVSLMEANIEEPISLQELAEHVGLSRRQLERLFQQYIQCVPTRYYLELRLERARQLLLQTSTPIAEIAIMCGFSSAPHFSKCYRDTFGLPPRDERRRALGQLQSNKKIGLSDGAQPTAASLHRTTFCSASAPV